MNRDAHISRPPSLSVLPVLVVSPLSFWPKSALQTSSAALSQHALGTVVQPPNRKTVVPPSIGMPIPLYIRTYVNTFVSDPTLHDGAPSFIERHSDTFSLCPACVLVYCGRAYHRPTVLRRIRLQTNLPTAHIRGIRAGVRSGSKRGGACWNGDTCRGSCCCVHRDRGDVLRASRPD